MHSVWGINIIFEFSSFMNLNMSKGVKVGWQIKLGKDIFVKNVVSKLSSPGGVTGYCTAAGSRWN